MQVNSVRDHGLIPRQESYFDKLIQEINQLDLPCVIKNLEHLFLFTNASFCEMHGVSSKKIIHTFGEEIYSRPHLERNKIFEKKAAEENTISFIDHFYSQKLNKRRTFRCEGLVILDAQTGAKYLLELFIELEGIRSDRLNKIEKNIFHLFSFFFPNLAISLHIWDETTSGFCKTGVGSPPAYWSKILDRLVTQEGAAIFTKKIRQSGSIIHRDIKSTPKLDQYLNLQKIGNNVALWVYAISPRDKLLGVFLLISQETREPNTSEHLLLSYITRLSGILMGGEKPTKTPAADTSSLSSKHDNYLATILDNVADGVLTLNDYGEIESANKAVQDLFKIDIDNILGRPINVLFPKFEFLLLKDLKKYEAGESISFDKHPSLEGRKKTGENFPVQIKFSRITHQDIQGFVVNIHDISDRLQQEKEVMRLAFYDALTELPNRRLLMDRLRQAIANSCRSAKHGAIMFLDLDHFKQLNDTKGHDVGDELLIQVAKRLRECVRECDTVARLGGDEFVVLLENLSVDFKEAAHQSEYIANNILKILGEPYQLREFSYNSTPSIGISLFYKGEDGVDNLLKRADVAMYQAKAAGRNTSRFFDQYLQDVSTINIEMEHDLRLALSKNEIVMFYQPQIDRDGLTLGVEALMRWNSSTRGAVPPSVFIPLAEKLGLISAMGIFAFEEACKQAVLWSQDPMTAHWTLAVNVSAYQFAQDNFIASVERILQETSAPPAAIKLELTESMLANDIEDIIAKMNILCKLGITFSLDDFGTGYSSLSYLKRLPLSQLKIDQSFVKDVITSSSDAAIARTVVALGHSLGLNVIAEGVETIAQRDFLLDIGCDAFQGYLISMPVDTTKIPEKLQQSPVVSDWVYDK